LERERLFLGFFLLRIAFFTNLLGLDGFLAAFVIAFLVRLLGFVAAAFGMSGNAHPRQRARENSQQFDGLHFSVFLSIDWCLARLHDSLANLAAPLRFNRQYLRD
jgi:hypothetical protein